MYDADTGEIDRITIIRVLRFYKVDMSDPDPCDSSCTLLIKGMVVKSIPIPDPCPRRLAQKLAAWFVIPTHHFYHPEMMEELRLQGNVN